MVNGAPHEGEGEEEDDTYDVPKDEKNVFSLDGEAGSVGSANVIVPVPVPMVWETDTDAEEEERAAAA